MILSRLGYMNTFQLGITGVLVLYISFVVASIKQPVKQVFTSSFLRYSWVYDN